ncbi:hypothetical protein KUCAC02_022521, partial [Chaenocephalus aceratus]
NSTALGDGEREPICRPEDTVGLPPPPAGGVGGPPPPRHMLPFHSFHCHGSDLAIHPICPWPRPEPRLNPREEA